ncbi:MAG: hypothetical protein OXL41_12890 [Nitrospinae bacterium]|nr:hypothetical protein [Nitrospinota bacterium]
MGTRIEDIIRMDVAFVDIQLSQEMRLIEELSKALSTDIIVLGDSLGTLGNIGSPNEKMFSLPKERITIATSSNPKITRILIDYPHKDFLPRFVQIARQAVLSLNLDVTPNAFGFNVDISYEQDSGKTAMEYIASRLYSPLFSGPQEGELIEGAGRFTLKKDATNNLGVRIEPRLNDRTTSTVFMSVNHHVNEARFPEEPEILRYLQNILQQTYHLVELIDGPDRPK